ncbi:MULTISPECIES: fructose-6-phosphate aldolase [Acidiplasma]|jgi:transaldolase|uniref:Probable transaldolase n=2 Tax=Acidiplasma TaxID=507753 RepID=A0A0Q0WEV3_9ARCH|nr:MULTISPECIES: fructose-6-phosphate aldolase [Acidiplasma]KJE49610.1 transaldolase [Acidiplasma sp. MBA-1]KPV47149.1 transaldolase [Acidiplasma aeolicum]KQB33811.1 fructose-6-phosphate aldolase [Acidiplasma aeolicum]KQB33913.1 fructose-6-phosphate aldolase [Acidiplasma cupricumulans]WMT55843.1 MAG: fructose-6-phosphate aldolase [Acidiplasma sp.]
MKIFIDTADINEIREANDYGLIDGVTTNPTLISKAQKDGKKFIDIASEILKTVNGPVSLEVVGTKSEDMVEQAVKLHNLGSNAVIKIPMTLEGLKAMKILRQKNIPVNTTLIFNTVQALLAARNGAAYVSPFVGRLDDIAEDGMSIINQIKTVFSNYGFKTEILVASVRNPVHVLRAALIGADAITIPFDVIKKLAMHPKTDEGLSRFLDDWKKVAPDGSLPL